MFPPWEQPSKTNASRYIPKCINIPLLSSLGWDNHGVCSTLASSRIKHQLPIVVAGLTTRHHRLPFFSCHTFSLSYGVSSPPLTSYIRISFLGNPNEDNLYHKPNSLLNPEALYTIFPSAWTVFPLSSHLMNSRCPFAFWCKCHFPLEAFYDLLSTRHHSLSVCPSILQF